MYGLWGGENMDQKVQYGGFIIDAHPRQLQTKQWVPSLTIERHIGSEIRTRLFTSESTFAAHEDALEESFRLGRRIIDDQEYNCTVRDL